MVGKQLLGSGCRLTARSRVGLAKKATPRKTVKIDLEAQMAQTAQQK